MKHLLWLLLTGCLCACKTSVPPDVKDALKLAGDNRSSLEKVLKRYRREPEKFRATCFLIANMPLHNQYAKIGWTDTLAEMARLRADSVYYRAIKSMTDETRNHPDTLKALRKIAAEFRKKVQETAFREPEVELGLFPDITTLDSAFLVTQIEHAFALRKSSPLVHRLTFEAFQEMVLPYRSIGDYPLVYASPRYAERFARYLRTGETDSVQLVADRYKHAVNHLRGFLGKYPFLNNMGLSELAWSRVHDCTDIAYYGACVLRACGVPALVGYNSAHKLYTGRHFHVSVIDRNGKWLTFSPESNLPLFRDQRFTQSANILYLYFGKRKNNPAALRAKGEYIPENLSNPCMEDHTERIMETVRIALPCGKGIPKKNKLAYLATFHSRKGLQVVTWGVIDRSEKQVVFEKVVPDNLYFPVCYTENGELQAFASPFIIKRDRQAVGGYQLNPVFPTASSRSVPASLLRKFPVKPAMYKLAKAAIGTAVIASDYGNFKKADTLARIETLPENDWQDLDLDNSKAYRHYRIISPPTDRHIRLSEVEFLTSKTYNYPNVMPATPLTKGGKDTEEWVRLLAEPLEKCKHRKEYDGKVQTAPEAYPSITFKLKSPQVVTRLRYAVKNAGNAIVYGNTYKLFVWNSDGWKLLWTRKADTRNWSDTELNTETLYWLHNPEQGTEEMPFTINEKGEQQFVLSFLL